MPSDSMNIQEQGFRSRMFGGFDKNDVLAYMNTLANEPSSTNWNTRKSCASFKPSWMICAASAVMPKPASRP